MFAMGAEEKRLCVSLEDVVWAGVWRRERFAMAICLDEDVGRGGEILGDLSCRSDELSSREQIFPQSAGGDGSRVEKSQGRIQPGQPEDCHTPFQLLRF